MRLRACHPVHLISWQSILPSNTVLVGNDLVSLNFWFWLSHNTSTEMGKKYPLENLEKQSSKIRVIKDKAPTVSRRSPMIYLKVPHGRLRRWHGGFRWFPGAGRSDIWKTLSFTLALTESIKMVSRSHTYRTASWILHRWCRCGTGEKGLSVDALSLVFLQWMIWKIN